MSKKRTLLVETPAHAVKDWMIGLRQALFDAVNEEDVKQIAQGLVQRAKDGDLNATKVLFTYVVGQGGLHVHNHQTIVQHPDADPPALNGHGRKRIANGA